MNSHGPDGTDAGALRPPMSVLEPSTGMNRHQKARTQQGLGEGHDVLRSSFSRLRGSEFKDRIKGDDTHQFMDGASGNDVFRGRGRLGQLLGG